MSLTEHARASRILAEELRASASEVREDATREMAALDPDASKMAILTTVGLLLWGMAEAHLRTAQRLEAIVHGEALAAAAGHACTFDHATMPTPTCPACKAPRKPK